MTIGLGLNKEELDHIMMISHFLKLLQTFLCEAYEVGWDFTFPRNNNHNHNNNNNHPHTNLAASHTGAGPSCSNIFFVKLAVTYKKLKLPT